MRNPSLYFRPLKALVKSKDTFSLSSTHTISRWLILGIAGFLSDLFTLTEVCPKRGSHKQRKMTDVCCYNDGFGISGGKKLGCQNYVSIKRAVVGRWLSLLARPGLQLGRQAHVCGRDG